LSAYADTSFLVSLYAPDANSVRAASQMNSATLPILLTPLGELELLNALELRRFRRELNSKEVRAARAAFRKDLRSGIFDLKPLSPAVYERAKLLSRRRTSRLGARSLDILHVAAAIVLHANPFYSFDLNQSKLARAEGLRTLT
jgi:predicted nucleic acid-binding protein